MRILLVLISMLPIGVAHSESIGFDKAVPGKLPVDWTAAMTHAGAPPRWEIVRDESAPSGPNVLAQLSRDRTAGRFPLAIWNRALLQDGELTVAFKTVDGSVDQAAGIVWRYQDPRNYYIVRANALENNVVLYKVENGVRASIAPKGLPSRSYGVKHLIPSGRWAHAHLFANRTLAPDRRWPSPPGIQVQRGGKSGKFAHSLSGIQKNSSFPSGSRTTSVGRPHSTRIALISRWRMCRSSGGAWSSSRPMKARPCPARF